MTGLWVAEAETRQVVKRTTGMVPAGKRVIVSAFRIRIPLPPESKARTALLRHADIPISIISAGKRSYRTEGGRTVSVEYETEVCHEKMYTPEQKTRAVRTYHELISYLATLRFLGYPYRHVLFDWMRSPDPKPKPRKPGSPPRGMRGRRKMPPSSGR